MNYKKIISKKFIAGTIGLFVSVLIWFPIFTVVFGLLLLVFLKKLKKLTHGAEDINFETKVAEGFELAEE